MNRVLFLEWKSFGNDYMITALKAAGYEVDLFPFPRDTQDTRLGEHLATEIAKKLLEKKYDYIFSFNYFPVAAIAAKACKVIYVSWVYDSPYIQLYSQTIHYDTNRVFIFDSAEVENLRAHGVKTVEYLPMAAPATYYKKLLSEHPERMKKEYECDVAFIGSTYMEEKQHLFRHLKDLDPYTKGYLEGVMNLQKNVYGVNFMEKMLTPEIVENMRRVCPVTKNGDGFETVEWVFATYFLDRKITAMERQEILQMLSNSYKVNLYTPEKTPNLPKINNLGKVDYYTESPFAFSAAKINLNISLKSIINGIPLRVFDIMACKGFVLTNYQPDLLAFFESGEDFVYYEDYEDLLQKVEYYLKNDEERERIAKNGYEKVKQYHSFEQRIPILFGE